jgi:hypothetical protein
MYQLYRNNCSKKSYGNIWLGQDPDVLESLIRLRKNSSGSATLLYIKHVIRILNRREGDKEIEREF